MNRRPVPVARPAAARAGAHGAPAARPAHPVAARAAGPARPAVPLRAPRARPGGLSGSRRGAPGEREQPPSRGRPARRAVVVALVVLAVLVGAVWAVLGSPLTRVQAVSVSGATRTPAAAVAAAARPQLGTPLLRWDADAVRGRLREQPYVASVSLARGWPDRLEVVVVERVPVAAVPRGQGGFSVVDAAGAVITDAPAAPAGLPVVEVGVPAGPRAVESASQVARSLPAALRGDVRSVGATGRDDVVLSLRDGTTVRWGGTDRPRGKAGVLALLRRKAPDVAGYDVSAPSTPATWPREAPGPAPSSDAAPPGPPTDPPAAAGGGDVPPPD